MFTLVCKVQCTNGFSWGMDIVDRGTANILQATMRTHSEPTMSQGVNPAMFTLVCKVQCKKVQRMNGFSCGMDTVGGATANTLQAMASIHLTEILICICAQHSINEHVWMRNKRTRRWYYQHAASNREYSDSGSHLRL